VAITITADRSRRRGGTFRSTESLTQSTATAYQSVNLTTDLTTLGMGTATGFGLNQYRVTDGFAGLSKSFLATASGEAKLVLDSGTATGQWVLDSPDDFLVFRFEGFKWRLLVNSGCTNATAT
jgi:hypothetical protein